ncbi:putative cupredoxin, multicopper oxidase, type 2 [Helianthus annuus]|nr:putative cupredoxin, multicopper oxidase, type 2 [Helianthus annuus]
MNLSDPNWMYSQPIQMYPNSTRIGFGYIRIIQLGGGLGFWWWWMFKVYPKSWTALYVPLDNVGMWNIRSQNWARQYLGQQFYLRVYSPVNSWRDEYPIPKNAITCGRASGRKTRPL